MSSLLSFTVRADDTPLPPAVAANARRIDGMIFIPSRLVRDPFITTSFGLTGQYGIGQADGPGFDVLGQTVGKRTYQLGAVGGEVRFSGALLPWLALRLGIEDIVFSGVNGPSALVAGLSAMAGGSGGFTGSWAINDHVRAGFLVDVRDRERVDLLPLDSVAHSIASRFVELTGIAPITNILAVSGGGVVAIGFARSFAADLTLEYTYQHIVRGGGVSVDDAHDMRIGALAEVDLSQITPVPLGFVASYRLDNVFASDDTSREHRVDFAINYTGRPNLVLGLDASGEFLTIRNDLDTRAFMLTFVLTYFWA